MQNITIQGARTHNLKNLSLTLPRDKLIVITGPSGSGKSSLAFDTLYAEGQRRYVESLSAYARQFLSMMEKPDVDHIEGLSPAISIEQKSTSHNPRSTVGTITEIYDYLRLLYARIGTPICPAHKTQLQAQTISQMVDAVLALKEDTKIMLLAPIIRDRKGEYLKLFSDLHKQGYIRARINGEIYELDDISALPTLAKNKKHTIEVVIDRFKVRPDIKARLADSFNTALKLNHEIVYISFMDDKKTEDILFSATYSCPYCGYNLTELEPRLFSFNSPHGACVSCDGLGVKEYFDPNKLVPDPSLNLASGAIKGWDGRNTYYMQMLESLAAHYKFSLDTPFEKLSAKIKDIILYGSQEDKINFIFTNQRGGERNRKFIFEGVIHNFTRRYRETDSNIIRETISKYLSKQPCPDCEGTRLSEKPRNVFINNINLPSITELTIEAGLDFFNKLTLSGSKAKIAEKIVKEIIARLQFLHNVGLDYLNLNRSADSLSGGEAQRIRLASQIGAGLVGVMYILDEPTIGLHQRDNDKLIKTLNHLKNLGNTVIVVEHDEDVMLNADHILDIGPGAGIHGGEIIAQGTPSEIKKNKNSITGLYLSGKKKIAVPKSRNKSDKNKQILITDASANNLKNVSVNIPVGLFTCITGVSGSGKSTLINDTLYPYVANKLNNASLSVSPVQKISGIEYFDKVIDIDQSPIGRTPRSNPATYTGLFTPIRELYAGTPDARARGYEIGRFSFNVKGGRCEGCQGDGLIKVEMHFLPDIYVTCDFCYGKRYNRETLEITYKGKNINQVLEMIVEEAYEFFKAVPSLEKKLKTLIEVGLGYIHLGQSATTLSGGEAQRVKLAKELSKRDTGSTLYILDEPTTGLHFQDIELLLKIIHELRDRGNTIVIIEHNLDVIKTADWIIDLGPDGGFKGGEIIAQGTPEDICKNKKSKTGLYLKRYLDN
ncbi:MAG: excinuclease ABC subunit UvrA [Gammaproteobacteria bacterium]|nr:excinuclease ABC subunit UvrA [Gammaproteobacteria bacterium]